MDWLHSLQQDLSSLAKLSISRRWGQCRITSAFSRVTFCWTMDAVMNAVYGVATC